MRQNERVPLSGDEIIWKNVEGKMEESNQDSI